MQVIVTYVIEIPRWYFFLFKLLIFQLPIINLLHKIGINEEKKKRNKQNRNKSQLPNEPQHPKKKNKTKGLIKKGAKVFRRKKERNNNNNKTPPPPPLPKMEIKIDNNSVPQVYYCPLLKPSWQLFLCWQFKLYHQSTNPTPYNCGNFVL